MTLSAKRKLDGAKYHLDLMKTHVSDRSKFTFDLEAFLSAARSVTLLLQKELSDEQGFEEWYNSKQTQMKQEPLFSYFNRKRTFSIHEGPTELKATFNLGYSVDVLLVRKEDRND